MTSDTPPEADEQGKPNESYQIVGPWETPIIRNSKGNVIGATCFLDEEVLASLGLDLESETKLLYQITEEETIQISNLE